MSATFTAGAEVYDIHGRAATYVAAVSSGHIVEPIYEHDDYEEPSYGQPETWREVFAVPPTAKLHAEVAEIEQQLLAARNALAEVRAERRAEDAEYAARGTNRKQFEKLKNLDDFIAGKITHFVVQNDYSDQVTIEPFDSFMPEANERRYEKKLRLLSLYGDSKGDLSWRIERYSDGSGDGWKHGNCWPAISYEDALAKADAWLQKRYAEWRKEPDGHQKYKSLAYADSAAALGLTIPEDIAAHAKAMREKHLQAGIASAKKDLDAAQLRYNNAIATATGEQQ